jgi:molybdopterin synthase catalytic subunit
MGGTLMRVEITDEAIAGEEIIADIKAGEDGAVCVFDGIVRNNTRGRKTLYLDYEAYREMALEKMQGLGSEAIERFGVRDVALVHRLGRLMVGETSVLIVVASAHRGAAFEACRWLIDTLKKTVPIWKKEQFVDGAIWADGEPFPEEIAVASRDAGASGISLEGAHILEPGSGEPGKKGNLSEALDSGGVEKSGHASHDAHTSEAMYGAPESLAKVEGGGGR